MNPVKKEIEVDAIAFCPSGLLDLDLNVVLGYLHKAIKPVNQLKMMTDSLVIYRLARAPERRIFYIDVGSLPKTKAEQYVKAWALALHHLPIFQLPIWVYVM